MSTRTELLIVLILTVFHGPVNPVPSIGTNNETASTPAKTLSFYLNTAYAAPHSGTVKEWRYCYYKPNDTTLGDNHRVTLAVYRMDGFNYERVSDMFTILRWRAQFPVVGNFVCGTQEVPDFVVAVGDVVGVCIFDPVDDENRVRKQLDIVGETSGYSLMQMTDTSECTLDTIPSTVSSSHLSVNNTRILHLYANITTFARATDQTTVMQWDLTTPGDKGSRIPTTTDTIITESSKESGVIDIAIGLAVGGILLLSILSVAAIFILGASLMQQKHKIMRLTRSISHVNESVSNHHSELRHSPQSAGIGSETMTSRDIPITSVERNIAYESSAAVLTSHNDAYDVPFETYGNEVNEYDHDAEYEYII